MHVLNQCLGLLLWMCLLTTVCAQGCTLTSFKDSGHFDENFETSNLRENYASGDSVRVPCKVGYRGFFKLTCNNGKWSPQGNLCSAISCGHPGDVQFADFALSSGDDYVFGSQVRYTCHKGYQMTSYTSTRNCLQTGWDGHLPVCEPISCEPLTVDDNIMIHGFIEQPTAGSVIQFSCRERGDELIGPSQIICNDNGQWNNKPPKCKEISCRKPELNHFQVEGEKEVYKEREVLRYTCVSGYKQVDERPSLCLKQGQSAQWTPTPQCEPVTCKVDTYPPVGTTYRPQGQNIFTPGQTLSVSCGDKKWVKRPELQSAQLMCQSTGNWDFHPVCKPVKCQKSAPHVYRWENRWTTSADLDQTLWYECRSNYEATSSRATCTRQGWEPNPLCKERRCTTPTYENAESTYPLKEKYDNYESVNFQCTYEPRTNFYIQCYNGRWLGSAGQCKGPPCTTHPSLTNGEMREPQRDVYEDGDTVLFRCTGETETFRIKCDSGVWKNKKSCENIECTTPEIENAEMVTRPRPPYPHGQNLMLTCTTGTKERFSVICESGKWTTEHQCKGQPCTTQPSLKNGEMLDPPSDVYEDGDTVPFRCIGETDTFTMTCNSGVWKHEKTCKEPTACPRAEILHGFSHEYQNKLYYTCLPKFKLLGKGWWDVASCERGRWNTQECIDNTDCGPVPHIPNLNVTDEVQRFQDGDTFPIHCEAGYQNLHKNLKELTCTEGEWSYNMVDLNSICTPLAEPCGPPDQVNDALILAPSMDEYPSGTVLNYTCRHNYIMKGNRTTECKNGKWLQESISCNESAGRRSFNMDLSASALLLLIGSTVVSAQECTQLPNVPNAKVVDRKTSYQKGDSVSFNCDTGFISGRQIRFLCSDSGWTPAPGGVCRLKPCPLPEDIPNGYYLMSIGDEFAFGTTIKYICNEGYQMGSKEDTRTCLLDGWSNHVPVCEPLSCDVPPQTPGVTVKGLPSEGEYILPDRFLSFSCDSPDSTLNGSATLICGKNGQWDHPFPNCLDLCTLPSSNPNMKVTVPAGHSVTVECVRDGSSTQLQCLRSGQWSSTFPTCTNTKNCGPPPPLENGDFLASGQTFRQNSRVRYQCQAVYVMEGEPYKTCLNGEWTGEIKCLKPCTVNPDLMGPNNLRFKHGSKQKLYAPHNDHITFTCIDGTYPVGSEGMRRICEDGVMRLPTCAYLESKAAMKPTVILMLFLWSFVEFTSTLKECSKLPSVQHAFVLDEYKKAEYQEGDVIYFCCDPGFTTGLNTTYICTEHGWRAATIGQCIEDSFPVLLGCTPPPPVTNGYVLQNTTLMYGNGQIATYQCNSRYKPSGGSFKICNNGQWTGDVQCIDSQSCGPPPFLENGDFIVYSHNSQIKYQCHSMYTMEGEPYKTCLNGEWTGEIKCLKPCTVNPDLMGLHNIRFKFASVQKLYSLHNDHITFTCVDGTYPVGSEGMRRICKDGVMRLPSCA
ncbi:complement factor H-like [Periophthalmus magnuspinnatus]|uniref:complement factor H-like n=1 Tax=Periophthalmus magnuspinnatus TaxID=409849 RepID=UPI00243682B4|nr:complement factor H-like [Periophthalmus magnuspinnatus]